MGKQPAFASLNREIFVLRLWRKTPPSPWIVEIQNVKTGEVTHLSGLEAIARYIEEQVRSSTLEPDVSPFSPSPPGDES